VVQHRGRARSVGRQVLVGPVWESFGELAEGSNYAEAEARECSGQVSPIVRGNSLGGVG
jgi:hypothetical protein